ncbi:UNVERIFIED_CONTAM: putative inactive peptidyl-prolyl cis-trans isomerase-like 6 [Siphonaria sp. JEL0065]|nr:putative inactive peptidyl-prolyl cis-trans isomerase-like 6 [Siphonaria sp. JEL0065]
MPQTPQKIAILGSVKAPEYQRVSRVCKEITDFIPSLFPGVVVRVYTGGKASVKSAVDFISWAKKTHDVNDVMARELGVDEALLQKELENLGQLAFEAHIKSLNHTIVHMDVQVGNITSGRLWFELYNDIVPKSVAHFASLISGAVPSPVEGNDPLGYKNSQVNRIIKEGWFQAGEIYDMKGKLAVGEYLPDENFIIPHSHRGNLSFVNKGPHSNFSQFMVTFRPMPYFDKKFVCIGRCLDGDHVLKAIDEVKTRYEKPAASIRINKCEVFCEGVVPPEKDLVPTFF